MPDKIAIIGSCVSTDWIHFRDHAVNWPFELPPMRQHSAIVSLLSAPCSSLAAAGDDLTNWELQQLSQDIDKSGLAQIAECRPRLLIVDLAIDAGSGVARVPDGWITASYILRKSPLMQLLTGSERLSPICQPRAYALKFERAVAALDTFLRRALPGCRVILHKSRFAEAFIDKAGRVRSFEDRIVQTNRAANSALAMLEDIFERRMNCEAISMTDEGYLADARHIWGLGSMHFERRYYRRFQDELARILDRQFSRSGDGGIAL